MFKKLKKNLKTFPADAQAKKPQEKTSADFENSLASNIVQEVKDEVQLIKFEMDQNKKSDEELKILGELLGYLRSSKMMSALMVCRQIKQIEISEGIAILSGDDSISELISNENLNKEVSAFFEKHGLGFKVKGNEKKETDEDVLKKLIGKKLVIKN